MDSLILPLRKFDSLFVKGRIALYLIYTPDTNYVKIIAARSLIEDVSCLQKGKSLFIEEKNSCHWTRNLSYYPVVYVYYSHFRYFRPDNYMDNVFLNDFQGDSISIDYWIGRGITYFRGKSQTMNFYVNAGGGCFVAKGKTKKLYIYHCGTSKLFFRQVEADTLMVDNRSNNDVFVTAKYALIASIHYTGNIYYTNVPLYLYLHQVGSGKLIYVDD
ncbi:MAG: DUF2807 domain-containing protein [Bacteroidales bacterium]|nr:DUF2807 domain-containing protein [Bacteroidales bacterium]